jgi:hypothetical protein
MQVASSGLVLVIVAHPRHATLPSPVLIIMARPRR